MRDHSTDRETETHLEVVMESHDVGMTTGHSLQYCDLIANLGDGAGLSRPWYCSTGGVPCTPSLP